MTDEKDSKRILMEHASVLDRIQIILQEYKPTVGMSTFEALTTIAKQVKAQPINAIADDIEKRLAAHSELVEKMPLCSCPRCLAEADLPDISRNTLEYVKLLKFINKVLNNIDHNRFLGFSFVIGEENEDDHGTHTWSTISALSKQGLQLIIGMAGVDFLMEYAPELTDEGKIQILLGAIEDAKTGGKWQGHEMSKAVAKKMGRLGSGLMGCGGPLGASSDLISKLKEMMGAEKHANEKPSEGIN